MKRATAHSIPTLLSALTLAVLVAHSGATQPAEPAKQPSGMPASTTAGGKPRPKALNPQPEVPSKQGMSAGKGSPKALNPQPEVPSKQKKKKKGVREKKKLPGQN